jgi:hypothetical protein
VDDAVVAAKGTAEVEDDCVGQRCVPPIQRLQLLTDGLRLVLLGERNGGNGEHTGPLERAGGERVVDLVGVKALVRA